MVKITLANDESIIIDETTQITGWKALNAVKGKEPYYAELVYSGTVTDGRELDVTNPAISLSGFISSVDWFGVGDTGYTFYKSSSVVKIAI